MPYLAKEVFCQSVKSLPRTQEVKCTPPGQLCLSYEVRLQQGLTKSSIKNKENSSHDHFREARLMWGWTNPLSDELVHFKMKLKKTQAENMHEREDDNLSGGSKSVMIPPLS